MQSLVESLDYPAKRAVSLVGMMIKMHGGKDGDGAFQGVGRYGVLTSAVRLCAEQSRSVQGFWDRMARRMRWTIGQQRYDDAILALISPDESDAETLRALADRAQSVVMIARSLARRERSACIGAPITEAPPLDDPLDVFFLDDQPETAPADAPSGVDDLFGE